MARRCIKPGDYGAGVSDQAGHGASHEDCARGVSIRVIFLIGGALIGEIQTNAEAAESAKDWKGLCIG